MVEQEPGRPPRKDEELLSPDSLPVGGVEWPPDIGGGPPDHGLVEAEATGAGPGGEPPAEQPPGEEYIATWEEGGGPVFRDTRFGRFDRRAYIASKWLSYLAGIALLVVVVLAFVDVVSTKFFNYTIPNQHDIIALLNLVLVFLAITYGQLDRGATAIELIQKHYNRWPKVVLRTLGALLGFVSCELLAWRGFVYMLKLRSEHVVTGAVPHISAWPFDIAFWLGFFLMGLAFLMTITRDLINFKLKEDRYAPRPKKSAASAASE